MELSGQVSKSNAIPGSSENRATGWTKKGSGGHLHERGSSGVGGGLELELRAAVRMLLSGAPYVFGVAALALAIEATFKLNPIVGGFWLRFLVGIALFGYAFLANQLGCPMATGSTTLVGGLILASLFMRSSAVSRSFKGRWSWNLWLIAGIGISWLLLRSCIKRGLLG